MIKDKINPLNVLEARRVSFCPPYFNSATFLTRYNLEKAINEWIYDNLTGRYFIGKTITLDPKVNNQKLSIKVAFENPSEMSYFMLACPLLKYNK